MRPLWTLQTGQGLLLVLAFSAWAAVMTILFVGGDKLHSLPMMAAIVLPLAMYASKNPRLFLLVSAASSAVLGLSINLDFAPHIGGAASFSIELVDIFTVPLAIFLVRDHLQGLRHDVRLGGISAWWLALMALGLINLLLGPFREYVAFELLRMAKCWLLFLVIVNECRRERQMDHVVNALAWALLLNLLIAAMQFALKRTLGLQTLGEAADAAVLGANLGVYGTAGSVYRISGLLGHPNLFATYLAMLLPIFTALIFADQASVKRAWLALLSIFGVAGLLLTLSRTGWADYAVAMLIVMSYLYFHPACRNHLRGLRLSLTLGLVVALLYALPTILTRLTASDSGALDSRYEMMGVAWRMVQAKPIFGFGLNSFSYQMLDYAPYSIARMTEIYGPIPTVVHNIYMLVWAEQGTIGLLLFLGLNAHLLWLAWQNTRYRLSARITMLNVGAIGAMMAVMVDGLGSFYMRVPGPARIFWIIAALIVASRYWNISNLRWRHSQAALAGVAAGAAVSTPAASQ